MGERKGVNKYYPPDYDPSKGGLNKWQGTHALRERASKLHLGILVIRFEMPYNIWCEGCGNHIGTGVRYNAEKKKVGMYYTTPIYEFRMKCHLCDNYFDIRTDPANLDYEIRSGARRQERRWDPSENEQVAPEDKAVGRKMAADAMYRLEHGQDDKGKAAALQPVIRDLEDLQQSRWEDDFSANQLLRQRFRATENQIKAQEKIDAAHHLNVPLLPPSDEDTRQAHLLTIALKNPAEASAEKVKLIDTQSVFAKLKPKRVSRAVKKDIAKQSIHNIVAAGTSNFDSFKNDYLDRQLGAVVRVKKKRRATNKISMVRTEGSTENNNGISYNISNGSTDQDLNVSKSDTPSPRVPSPCSEESLMSPSSDVSMFSDQSTGDQTPSSSSSYDQSPQCQGRPYKHKDCEPSAGQSKKPKRTGISRLPSLTFGTGKDLLNFVTEVDSNYEEPSDKCSASTHISPEKGLPLENCIVNSVQVKSGLLVDYSGSDSD